MKKLATEGRRMAATTSVKGVPRIIRSQVFPLKALWFVSVVSFLGMAVYQTSILLMEYFSYPAITNVEEQHINLVNQSSVQLPHLTICNLNPLSDRAYANDEGILTVERYMRDIANTTPTFTMSGFKNPAQMLMNKIRLFAEQKRRLAYSPRGYYSHIGLMSARLVGHTQEEFIVVCKILILQGLDMDEMDCADLGEITLLQHPDYFNCFILKMGIQTSEELMVGYSVTLHLRNYGRNWYRYVKDQRRTQMGAIVALHEPNTYPNMVEAGHHISPGTHINLRYNLQQRNKLPAPYGNCMNADWYPGLIERYSPNFPFNYTTKVCVSLYLELEVIMNCNCTDITLMNVLSNQASQRNFTTCGEGRSGRNSMACARRIRKNRLYDAMTNCSYVCQKMIYLPEISQSVFPPDPVSPEFYESMIRGRTYEPHYARLRDAIQADENGSLTEDQHRVVVDYVRQNFVNINAYLGRLSLFNTSDTPKVSPTALISKLGGTLNFWAGITVALVIELIEFVIRLLFISSPRHPNPEIGDYGRPRPPPSPRPPNRENTALLEVGEDQMEKTNSERQESLPNRQEVNVDC